MRYQLILVVVGLLISVGCGGPEEKLAKHIGSVTELMEKKKESPKEGVEALHEYVRDNLPDMMKLVGEIIVDVDKTDPAKRADRIKAIVETLKPALEAMMKASGEFGEAAMKDKDAMGYVEDVGKSYESLEKDLGDTMKDIKGFSRMLR